MRQEKQYLSEGIVQQMGENPSFFLIRHEGLSANTVNSFRNEVAGLGGEVEFVKKRILVKAAEDAGCSLTLEQLPGHIGLVFGGEDPLPVAKHVFKFRKDFEEKLEVLGGRFEGQFYSGADVEALS
ncbi:MAG: 50S ribosomal protein L10, partial [Chlamydiia bacterium]|nr:50S ribosomal protein L10 [Chlamydiia bacterium]